MVNRTIGYVKMIIGCKHHSEPDRSRSAEVSWDVPQSQERPPPAAPGSPAPPLVGPALDGRVVRLEDYRGHAVLVSFLRHAG